MIYMFLFWALIIIILLNIIFGIIIDTFGELRTNKLKVEENMENTCFICQVWMAAVWMAAVWMAALYAQRDGGVRLLSPKLGSCLSRDRPLERNRPPPLPKPKLLPAVPCHMYPCHAFPNHFSPCRALAQEASSVSLFDPADAYSLFDPIRLLIPLAV